MRSREEDEIRDVNMTVMNFFPATMFAFPDVLFLTVNVYRAPRLLGLIVLTYTPFISPSQFVTNLATAMRKESLDPGYLKSVSKCVIKTKEICSEATYGKTHKRCLISHGPLDLVAALLRMWPPPLGLFRNWQHIPPSLCIDHPPLDCVAWSIVSSGWSIVSSACCTSKLSSVEASFRASV